MKSRHSNVFLSLDSLRRILIYLYDVRMDRILPNLRRIANSHIRLLELESNHPYWIRPQISQAALLRNHIGHYSVRTEVRDLDFELSVSFPGKTVNMLSRNELIYLINDCKHYNDIYQSEIDQSTSLT